MMKHHKPEIFYSHPRSTLQATQWQPLDAPADIKDEAKCKCVANLEFDDKKKKNVAFCRSYVASACNYNKQQQNVFGFS